MKKTLFIFAFILLLIVGGCTKKSDDSQTPDDETIDTTIDTTSYEVLNASDMFSDFDTDATYDENNAVIIDLAVITTASSMIGVSVTGTEVLISRAGTYVLKGDFEGSIKVAAGEQDKVHLVLDNVSIRSDQAASIYNYQSDKLKVTLKEGTINTLTNINGFTKDGDVNIDGVIFSRDDLVINGSGTLLVDSGQGNGIVGKDDLKITGGTLEVTVSGHGLEANDSIRIKDTSLTIDAGKDGIQAENEEDSTKGYVFIQSSTLSIASGNDGVQASSVLQIQSGSIKVTTAGGTSVKTDVSDEESYKGLKSSGLLYIVSGTVEIDAVDDAIHANGNVLIDGGSMIVRTLDDGIHADKNVVISNLTLSILESYEGIEGATITVESGTLSIVASDDGINASDGTGSGQPGFGNNRQPGNQTSNKSTVSITINGGQISILAGGDGIDSNGDLTINGGEVYVSAPSNAADGGLDFDGNGVINGGIVVATGSSNMSQNFTSAAQGSVLVNLTKSYNQNSSIIVKDGTGKTIISTLAQAAYNAIVVSSPDMKVGDTITLILDGDEQTISLTNAITSSGTGGMGGGQMGPGQGGQGGGRRP